MDRIVDSFAAGPTSHRFPPIDGFLIFSPDLTRTGEMLIAQRAPAYDAACGLSEEEAARVIVYASQVHGLISSDTFKISSDFLRETCSNAIRKCEKLRRQWRLNPESELQLLEPGSTKASLRIKASVISLDTQLQQKKTALIEISPIAFDSNYGVKINKEINLAPHQAAKVKAMLEKRGRNGAELQVSPDSTLGLWLIELFGSAELCWFRKGPPSSLGKFLGELCDKHQVQGVLLPVDGDSQIVTDPQKWQSGHMLRLSAENLLTWSSIGIQNDLVVQITVHGRFNFSVKLQTDSAS